MESRSCVLAVLAGILIFSVTGVYAVDFFPSVTEPTFTYEYGTVTIHNAWPGAFSRRVCDGCIEGSATTYELDVNNDILLATFSSWYENIVCPDYNTYTPSLIYLDFPLDIAKTWSSTAVITEVYGGYLDTVTLTGTVLGPLTVTVPAGDFEVIAVSLEYVYEHQLFSDSTQVLWLHRQLGPVNELVSWTGIVSQEDLDWGSVKSLFE